MSQLAADNIIKFVRAGGRILSTSDTSLIDDFWRRREGFALEQAMGVRPASPSVSAFGQISLNARSHQVFQGVTGPVSLPYSVGMTVNVEPDSNVLAVTASGLPAMVENRFGIYCAANILSPANLASPQGSALVRNVVTYLADTKYGAPFALDTIRVKAALYRPAATQTELRADMQRLAKANFNTVMVEAYRDGMALWNSQVAPVDPLYKAFDPVTEALSHRQGARPRGARVVQRVRRGNGRCGWHTSAFGHGQTRLGGRGPERQDTVGIGGAALLPLSRPS